MQELTASNQPVGRGVVITPHSSLCMPVPACAGALHPALPARLGCAAGDALRLKVDVCGAVVCFRGASKQAGPPPHSANCLSLPRTPAEKANLPGLTRLKRYGVSFKRAYTK